MSERMKPRTKNKNKKKINKSLRILNEEKTNRIINSIINSINEIHLNSKHSKQKNPLSNQAPEWMKIEMPSVIKILNRNQANIDSENNYEIQLHSENNQIIYFIYPETEKFQRREIFKRNDGSRSSTDGRKRTETDGIENIESKTSKWGK